MKARVASTIHNPILLKHSRPRDLLSSTTGCLLACCGILNNESIPIYGYNCNRVHLSRRRLSFVDPGIRQEFHHLRYLAESAETKPSIGRSFLTVLTMKGNHLRVYPIGANLSYM